MEAVIYFMARSEFSLRRTFLFFGKLHQLVCFLKIRQIRKHTYIFFFPENVSVKISKTSKEKIFPFKCLVVDVSFQTSLLFCIIISFTVALNTK